MFWRRRRSAADFAEEIRAHLQLEADEFTRDGLTDAEARAAARRSFGNVTEAEERFYERGRLMWFDDLLHDFRYGLRAMRKSPGFTAAVILTLALGMGANTAIFTLLDAVLLRSLPVKDPGSLYFLSDTGSQGGAFAPPYPCFERFRSLAKSFTGIAAYGDNDFGIRINGPIEQVDGAAVSGNYYDVLGVTAFAGRLLNSEDDRREPPVAVIGYEFWQRRFGGKTDAIGKTFSLDGALNGRKFTIVGITPRDFHGLTPGHHDDVTMPISIPDPEMMRSTNAWFFKAVARLGPGVTPERARAEIAPIYQTFMKEFPRPPGAGRGRDERVELNPASRGLDPLRKRFSRPLWTLMAVVGLVLLIGCANITNLLLARAAKREREFAVRVAIGAGRIRLFRQVLVETGLLFAAGTAAGVAVAWWAARGVTSFFAGGSRPVRLDIHWDWRVLAFTAGLSLMATLLFGTAPILRAIGADPHAAMKDGGRSTASQRGFGSGRFLVVFQVALSLILLAGAALFLRTLNNLYTNAAGFHANRIALISIHLPDASYHQSAARIALWDRLLAEVRSQPGVLSAGLSRMTPLDGLSRGVTFETAGVHPRPGEDSIGLNTVSNDYFQTMGIPLLQGRDLMESDGPGAPNVALINESARRQFFGGRDPLGAVVKLRRGPEYRIIGVVQDAKQADLRKEAGPFVYVPVRQPVDSGARMTLSVRMAAEGNGNAQRMTASVVRLAGKLGPDIHILHTETLARQLDESLLQERLIFIFAAAFGALALVLSAVGLYGVLAYSVARRTAEIGIRMTLGAMPEQVAWSVVRETLGLVAIGLAAGIPASILLAKTVEKLLYGVTPADVFSQAVSAGLMALVACAASYLPARRAARVDPATALRSE